MKKNRLLRNLQTKNEVSELTEEQIKQISNFELWDYKKTRQ